ncbi:aspartate ammonia-lyase [Candidatus Woesearchaeota archaeon]|nr:aspartate ammonia-lyase [Candidatus Woesearchaeota archaeon]
MKTRTEKDSLGKIEVPLEAYYGSFTVRAMQNFQISGIKAHKQYIKSLAILKKSCAAANLKLGLLDAAIGKAIIEAANLIISDNFAQYGKSKELFPLDIFQAGAGTPFNMNMNEVIANIAIIKLGGKQGDYSIVHPNNHVNMSQSSNDVTPTTIRLATLALLDNLEYEVKALSHSFTRKAREYKDVVKVGMTHLEDAVPITFGQVFYSYAHSLDDASRRISAAKESLLELGIGGTAIGTGLNTHPDFKKTVVEELSKETNFKLRVSPDSVQSTWSMAAFTYASSTIKALAIDINKICNDLRLMNSGPQTGFAQIILPEVEPGSSIMPGKVNPSIAECMNMICYQVFGNDTAITHAADNGQLELNVMTPVIGYNLFTSIDILAKGMKMLREYCADGIIVNEERCRYLLERNPIIATALNPFLGYEVVAELVKEALKDDKSIREVVLKYNLIPLKVLDDLLDHIKLTKPNMPDLILAKEIRSSKEYQAYKAEIGK